MSFTKIQQGAMEICHNVSNIIKLLPKHGLANFIQLWISS